MKMIDTEIKRHFDILKEHGYIMIYNDNLADKFKQFLVQVLFKQDRDYNCPERNRFEIEE